MIWYLIFCSSVYSGAVCQQPQVMETRAACIFVGQKMLKTHKELHKGRSNFKCAGVRKAKP